jgi:hypothetical protein
MENPSELLRLKELALKMQEFSIPSIECIASEYVYWEAVEAFGAQGGGRIGRRGGWCL